MPRVTKATNKKETKNTNKSTVSNSSSLDKVKKTKSNSPKATTKSEKKVVTKKVGKVSSSVDKKDATKKSTLSKSSKVEKPKTKSITTKKSKTVEKKETPKKVATKKETDKKAIAKTTKKSNVSKKTSNSKVTSKANSKKTVSKSSKPKKPTTLKKKSMASKPKVSILEYYDLPYRYSQTVVKILAQTPNTLFVYWDISDSDREKYVKEFGEYFFNDTIPILIVHNKTKNYSFEIEVNDFANSWYFKVADAKCDYEIEFGRRKKAFRDIAIPNDYVYITSSNVIEAPNDRFLFEPNNKTIFFRNVKTNQEFSKDITTFSFIEKISRIYNIYDIYKEIYKEEDLTDALNNPTSAGSSLSFYMKKD